MTDFDSWFVRIAGDGAVPHEWQRSLAADRTPRNRMIRIPTGMGKTLGVLAAWSWHRIHRADERWPRRLIWCLPMRVLVEQTEHVVRTALDREGVFWDGSGPRAGKVGVHLLMGGSDPGGDWNLFPEENAVLIGTQDMLLSRALNRGYASGRARWPLEFGLLSHDSLWVMDEVQLMDVGLATSAQLQAYHDDDFARGFRPRRTWWMSATLQPDWLKSVDTEDRHHEWIRDPTVVPADARYRALGSAAKSLSLESIPAKAEGVFAELVLRQHAAQPDGEHGRITLVVCNTVDRASATFNALRAVAPTQELELVHSRFRPAERSRWRDRFLSRAACSVGANRIIVATQVVEAGVDISAGTVITDLAPWPSLVQRFGRCARYGGSGSTIVVDRGRDEKSAPPYAAEELEAAWRALAELLRQGRDVGLANLESFEESLDAAGRSALYPYEPAHLLLRREFDELFDTTPDLTGADLDISRFIRSGEERDVVVFWSDVAGAKKGEGAKSPLPQRQPMREELCPVPFLRARDWLCGEESKTNRKPRLRPGMRAWTWDWIDGQWVVADRALLTPGRVVCVAADSGGYREDRGFAPESHARVVPVPLSPVPANVEVQDRADGSDAADDLSASAWKTIACHGGEVAAEADKIAMELALPADLRALLKIAGLWHDFGKSHPAFQGAIRSPGRPTREDLAKAPREAWPRPPKTYRTRDDRDVRPGLRHELASALALFSVLRRHAPGHPALLGQYEDVLRLTGQPMAAPSATAPPTPCEEAVLACSPDDFDLLAYLVACHHGKVRVSLHAGPKDQDYRDRDGRGLPIRGIREGDLLPSLVLDASSAALPAMSLTLDPASLGLSSQTGRSWRERTQGLLTRIGPGALAWLEALIIAADRRASKLATNDPAITQDTQGGS